MTIANVNIKKVLFRRGNTIQNDNYVGVFGEVSVDTQANTLRVHDGATAGGTRLATYAELTNVVAGNLDLTGYATTAQITAANTEIGKLRANITAANANIVSNYNTLLSNAGVAHSEIDGLRANITAANVAWAANAATQAISINTINANLGAFQTYANATFTGGGGGSTYSNTNVAAFLTTVSGNIIPSANVTYTLGDSTHWWKELYVGGNTIYIAGVPMSIDSSQNLLINGNVVQGNVTAVSANITAANSSIATTQANIGAYQIWANANAGAQSTGINTVNANIGAYQIWANGNAGAQSTTINTINANIGAYQIWANANAAAQTTAIDAVTTAWTANAGTQATDINALRANITAANTVIASLQTQTYSNTNVAAYLTTATGNIQAGNITITSNAVVLGNLRVLGTQTTVNAATLTVNDLWVTVANGAVQASDANGAGLRVAGALANIAYSSVSDSFEFNKTITTGNIKFSDTTRLSGNTVILPNSQGFNWNFNEPMVGSDTVKLYMNELTTGWATWALSTGNGSNSWYFDSDAQEFSLFNGGAGAKLVFGTAANAGVRSSVDDIELRSTIGNVYIQANANPWTFSETGNLILPTRMNFSTSPAISGTGIVFGDGSYQYTAWTGTPGNELVSSVHTVSLDTTGNLNVPGDILPLVDNLHDLGSATQRFRHLYVGPGTVYVGNAAIKTTATGNLILPGLTRPIASTAYAEEVDEEDDQTQTFNSVPTVIDNAHYSYLNGNPYSLSFTPAEYSVDQLDGDGFIDGITVTSPGVGYADQVESLAEQDMWATQVATPLVSFNAGDWVQIPFRVRSRAGESEYDFNTGGSSDRLVNNDQSVILGSDGNTTFSGTITMGNGDAVIGQEGDDFAISWDNEALVLRAVQDDVQVQSDRSFQIDTDYNGSYKRWVFDTNGYLVHTTGDTQVYSELGSLTLQGGAVGLGSGNVNIVAVETGVAIQTWAFGNDGVLTLPSGGDIVDSNGTSVLGGGGGNANTGNVVFTDNTLESASAEGFLNLYNGSEIAIGSNDNIPLTISVNQGGGASNWTFNTDGTITFPDSTVQTTAYTGGNVTVAPVIIGTQAEGDEGSLWYNTLDGRLYVDIVNQGTHTWVDANPSVVPANMVGYEDDGNIILNDGASIVYSNGVSILSGVAGTYGNTQVTAHLAVFDGNITKPAGGWTFSSTITDITLAQPVVVTMTDSVFGGPVQGTVTIAGVVGTTEINGVWGYEAADSNAFILYPVSNFDTAVDGTSWTPYVSGGTAVADYQVLQLKGDSVKISTHWGTEWMFDPEVGLIFPDETIQTTAYTGGGAVDLSNYTSGNIYINGEGRGLIVDEGGLKRYGFMKYFGIEGALVHNSEVPLRIGRTAQTDVTTASAGSLTTEIFIAANGKVGINTVGPTEQLDVEGNVVVRGNIYTQGNIVHTLGAIEFVASSSGDGYGLSTMSLKPYTSGYEDAYIILDPTYPNHIHIRAGGAQDNSTARLFLGGEITNFNIDSGAEPAAFITSNNNVWTFNTDGQLAVPGTVYGTASNVTLTADTTDWTFYSNGTTIFPDHGAVSITGNLTVGNLTVTGNSTIINTTSYTVSDNIIQMATDNPADTLDLGFVAHRTVNSTLEHTGLVRDASDSNWKLFSNVLVQPGNTVDFADAVYDNLKLGTVIGTLAGNIEAPFGYINFTSSPAIGTSGITFNDGTHQTSAFSNTQVASYLEAQNITSANIGTLFLGNASTNANLGAYQTWANATFSTGGGSSYGNTEVAAYLVNGTSGNIKTSSNVIAPNYLFANGVNILSTVGAGSYANADAAAYLAANTALYLGNPVARYPNQANVTQLFVGNTTTIGAGANQLGGTYILNNAYFGANGAMYARNTQTGAAQFSVSGGSFSWAGTTGAVTANSVQSFALWATLNSTTLTTYNAVGISSAGTITAQAGLSITGTGITTTLSSISIVNATATTINFGGAATSIVAGAATANLVVGTSAGRGNVFAGNLIGIHYGNAVGTTATYSTATYSGNVSIGNLAVTNDITVANITTTGTYGNITGANVISANTLIVSGNVYSNGNIAMVSNVARYTWVSNSAPTSGQGSVGDIWYQTF